MLAPWPSIVVGRKEGNKGIIYRNRQIAEEIQGLDVDVWIVHDSQPCLIRTGILPFRQAIWHCHIDTSTPNKALWNYLYRYIEGVKLWDRASFGESSYIDHGV